MSGSAGAHPGASDPDLPPAPVRASPKVIYIMGAGHSGSTILGVTLGNCEGMFFAGELDKYLSRSGVPVVGGLERTRFWGRVRERVPQAGELYGNQAHRLLERSAAAINPSGARARRRLGARYRDVTGALIGAIASTAGATHVIDTSHFPLRARELQRTDDVALYLVFLVRDPQAVVTSTTRLVRSRGAARRVGSILKVNAELWLTYALSLLVFRRQPPERRVFIRYEDFIAEPESVLRRILERGGSTAGLPDLDALQTGLAFHANRLIESDVVALKRGGSATSARGSSTLTTILQRPWSVVFGRLNADGP